MRLLLRPLNQRSNALKLVHQLQFRPSLRPNQPSDHVRSRSLSLPTAILAPPLTFAALLLSLWTLKSISLVVFQNKVIYLPYLPPYCRSEPLPSEGNGKVVWKDMGFIPGGRRWKWGGGRVQMRVVGTEVVAGVGKKKGETAVSKGAEPETAGVEDEVLVVYLQGNAGNAPMRIPLFNDYVLSPLMDMSVAERGRRWKMMLVYPSYRGYWTSTGSATGWGLREDVPYLVDFIRNLAASRRDGNKRKVRIVVWGQSIGALIAAEVVGLAESKGVDVHAMVLETPFTTLGDLVKEVYPQRWVPYGYLTRFLEVDWKLENGLRRWVNDGMVKAEQKEEKRVLLLQAEKDELVGQRIGEEVLNILGRMGVKVDGVRVRGAGHQGCVNSEGGRAVVRFLEGLVRGRVQEGRK